MASAAINVLVLTYILVLDLSHNELSPDCRSRLSRGWIAAVPSLLLNSLLLPPNPNANLLPVVHLEHTPAVAGANIAIKATDPRGPCSRATTPSVTFLSHSPQPKP
jgi:hypothetical protein